MHIADDVLGMPLVDGQARILVLAHAPQNLIQTGVHGNGYDIVARHHDLANIIILEFQQSLNGVFFETMQMPFAPAGADNELQLLSGVAASAMAAAQADPMGHDRGRSLRYDNKRR